MKKVRLLILISIFSLLAAQEAAPKHAVLKSAILPGWGELSYKSASGYVLLGTEIALWLGYGGLQYSGYVQNQDLMTYARINAGVTDYPDGNEYWADLGNYISRDDQEEDMLENRTPQDIWSSDYQWDWNSEEDLIVYQELYRKKELTLLSSEFVLTGMIVNRIASVINVRYLQQKNMNLKAYAVPVQGGGYLQLALDF